MHLPPALCIHFVIVSISPFSSQLLGEIRSNKNCPGCLDSLESRAGWYLVVGYTVEQDLLQPPTSEARFSAFRLVLNKLVSHTYFYWLPQEKPVSK